MIGEIIVGATGGVLLILQTAMFFILSDLRERVMRLESGQMKAAQVERSRHGQ